MTNVVKRYGSVTAVDKMNLAVKDKEFLVLVGPSGCGKTTTLRMIAGLDDVTEGSISIEGRDVTHVAPKNRDIAMVFQNYALYPHMNAYKNISFGLRLRKFSKKDIAQRVAEAARILGIEELLERKPKELSGGQRQRVAMGRAIVRKPRAFLFDEPLSNLDAKLRVQMRGELAKLHEQLETTVVYVTHDQIEAMTLADRIVIMNKGVAMQIGTPLDVYNKPQNRFVAGFIGSPAMNFLEVVLTEEGGRLFAKGDDFKLALPKAREDQFLNVKGQAVVLGMRPEHLYERTPKDPAPEGERLNVTVEVVEPVGKEVFVLATVGSSRLTACVGPNTGARPHAAFELVVDMDQVHFFDKATEKVI